MTKMSALKTIRPHELSGNVSPEALARGELIEFFKGKGVGVFDDESVDRYKNEKKKRSERIADFIDPIDSVTTTLWWILGTVLTGAVAVGLLGFQTEGLAWTLTLWVVCGALLGLTTGVAITVWAGLTRHYHMGAHWETVSYQKHNDDGRKIKRRVRELARMIQQERPDLQVLVERFAGDPFLTVRHPKEWRALVRVAVWDERGYRIAEL